MINFPRSVGRTAAFVCLVTAWPVGPLCPGPARAGEPDYVPWVQDLPTAMELARQRKQLVLIHFSSDSCPPCRRLEQHVFNQPFFGSAIGQAFVPVRVNVTLSPKIANDYQVQSWPTDVIVTATGQEVHRMISPQDGSQYLRVLQQVAWNYQQQQQQQMSSTASLVGSHAGHAMSPPHGVSSPLMTPAGSGAMANAPIAAAATPAVDPSVAGNMPTSQFPLNAQGGNAQGAPAIVVNSVAPSASIYGAPATAAMPQFVQNPYRSPVTTTESAPVPPPADPIVSTAAPASASVVVEPAAHLQSAATSPMAAAPPTTPSSASSPATVPSPSSAIGLDGYCPVTVMDENCWVVGDRQWGAQHRGRIYLFRDAAAQKRFLADPERYAPALAGFDPVRVTDGGEYVNGKREHGVRYNGRMYLFGSEEALQRFSHSPDHYVARVEQALQALTTK